MSVPSFLLPSNFRNQKNIKRIIKEFDIQGYGIVLYLLETLAETENHLYPYSDIDLLADEMRVSVQKIETVIKRYGVFEILQTAEGDLFFSSSLNNWLKPYYEAKQQRQIAGKISAEKRKLKQQEQLTQLSLLDSTQRPLNGRSTINELINKSINKESNSSSIKKFDWENQKDFDCFSEWLLENQTHTIKNERYYKNTILENLKNNEPRTIENWEAFCRLEVEEEKMIFYLRIEKLSGSTLVYKNELIYIERVEIDDFEKNFKIFFDGKVMTLLFSQLEEVEKLIKKDAS
ncbi:hypothetical protein AAX29_01346 [Aliarcobacter thereius]|uniref:Lin1244/Lin1753-like N-terminal domain-containing protein n=1 Tax=Aliarcobacter thereius TaxID=544718 RepID=A0A1C0B6B9_9BACT|nr:Lin1244/Lin1753 domain-containing protein [Aliarcobacter thereius]OCL98836.1 hypothetical protein AAX29_01346 [Aliarcobacter thereius]